MTPAERKEYSELVLLNIRLRKKGERLTDEQRKRLNVLGIKRYNQIKDEMGGLGT